MMPRPRSIRNLSSQSKMATPALHSIILETRTEGAAIREYFRIKKRVGSLAVPKPLLSDAVIAELRRKLRESSDARTSVQCVIVCLEEFSSNSEFREPWQSLHEEISDLILGCIDFFSQLRRNDFTHNTSNFDNCVLCFNKLCEIIYYAAEQNEPLSTQLFNAAASDLFGLLISKGLREAVFPMIVLALRSLSHNANKALIATTFGRYSIHLSAIARKIFEFEVECQVDLYYILHASLSNLEEAQKMAAVWFCRWPVLVDLFVDCFSKNLSEGAGLFTSKVHDLKAQASSSSVRHTRSTTAPESARTPSNSKVKVLSCSNVDGHTNQIEKGHDKLTLKGIQTPFYPDRRKCLTLRTEKNASAEHTAEKYNHNVKPEQVKGSISQTVSRGQTPKHLKQHLEKYDFESNGKKVSCTDGPKSLKVRHSPALPIDYENEKSKVQRWLRESPYEYSSYNEVDDSDTAQKNPFLFSDSASGGERNIKASKRSSSGVLSPSKRWKQTSSPDQSRASGISKNIPARTPKVVTIESDDEDAAPKGRQKGRRPLFSKVTEKFDGVSDLKTSGLHTSYRQGFQVNTTQQGNLWEEKLRNYERKGGVEKKSSNYMSTSNREGSQVNTTQRRSLWEQKLRDLELKSEVEKESSHDIYQYSTNLSQKKLQETSKIFKEPIGLAKKFTAASKPKSERNVPSKLKSSVNRRQQHKENIDPRTLSNSTTIRASEKINIEVLEPITTAKSSSKMTMKCYSPILDDSMEKSKSEEKASVPGTVHPAVAVYDAKGTNKVKVATVSTGTKEFAGKVGIEEACVEKKPRGRVAASNVVHNKQLVASEDSVKSPVSAKFEFFEGKGEHSSHDLSLKSQSQSSKWHVNQSRDVIDSGLEVTSDATSQHSNPKGALPQKKESVLSQFLKANMRDYIKNALSSNSELTKNQTEMTTEMVEIKGLAEKIAASADRCQIVGRNQEKIISENVSSLKKCSKIIDSSEERRANIKKELKARNTARILEAMKTALDENYFGGSSSDSE